MNRDTMPFEDAAEIIGVTRLEVQRLVEMQLLLAVASPLSEEHFVSCESVFALNAIRQGVLVQLVEAYKARYLNEKTEVPA